MGSIPLPALNIRPPQPQASPLEQYGNLMALKNALVEAPLRQQALQQQVQTGQINLDQAQQAQKDQQNLRAYFSDPANHGKTLGEAADTLLQSGGISPAIHQQLKKADLDNRQSLASLNRDELANLEASHKETQRIYDAANDMDDAQLQASWPSIAQQIDSIPGNPKILDPNRPMTKQELQQFGPLLSMRGTYLAEQVEKRTKEANAQKAEQEALQAKGKADPTSPFYAPSKESVEMGTAPGAKEIKAGEAAQAGAKAAAEAKARQPFEMALNRQRQALSQGDPKAAAQLLVENDATLSELKARGATPDFIARTLFEAKRMSGGKYNAQEAEANFKVAQSPTNLAFFGSAKSLTDKGGTLDQLAEAAKDIPHSAVTGWNSIEDWTKAATGDGPLAKYAATALGVADDYAKVMGGGQGSDTSRHQALELVKAAAGPDARKGSLAGIRGAVQSQIESRIGNNPVMKRMYGNAGNGEPAASKGGFDWNAHPVAK